VIEPVAPAPEPAPAPDPEAVANATIAAFRADPRKEFMPMVETQMRELLLSGQVQSLHEAYDQACMMSPHVQEIKMNRNRPRPPVNPYQSSAVQQSRAAAKAIGGAPSSSAKPKNFDSTGSTYDDVAAAVARQKGL
jgi:hypothetical protein